MGADTPPLSAESACVLGGGPAGCAAAIALARSGVQVRLWVGPAQDRGSVGECLSPAGPDLLRRLGVWERFLAQAHLPCPAQVSVWGGDTPVWRDFLSDPRGSAWHVDRPRLNALLRVAAVEAGAELDTRSAPRAWRRVGDRWTAEDAGLEGVAVIDATGRAAAFGRSAGARPVVAWEQVAVVGIGRHEGPDRAGPGLTEAVETGFWYSAPVPGGRWMAAHFTEASLLDRTVLGTVAGWQAQVHATRHIGGSLPPGLNWERPRVHPAGTRLLAPPAGPGWIAVGDAAMTWDPVSAHGLTLALRTGIDGAEALLCELQGDTGPRAAHVERLVGAATRFTAEVRGLWRQEGRWPDSDYWGWRHASGA